VGRLLPADLQQWWRSADGMNRGILDPLIPSLYTPIPIADALEIRQSLVNVWPADEGDDLGEVDESAEVAGAPSRVQGQPGGLRESVNTARISSLCP
jgi:hypothetical protein